MQAEVKVTWVPAQTWFADSVIVMLTGRNGFTVIAISFDTAGFPEAQDSLDVTIQATTIPFAGTKE
jgi:hypothetical protein